MTLRAAAIVVCASCGTAPAPPITAHAPTDLLGQQLDRARRAHGDLLLVSTDRSIEALTPDLDPVATIAQRRGYRAQIVDGQLYAIGARQLFHVDLRTGALQVDATLPELHHRCFGTSDPMEHMQPNILPRIDRKRRAACIHVQDRNDNMMSVSIDYRIDLATGANVHRTTFALPECSEPGEAKSADSPCGPDPDIVLVTAPTDTKPHSLAEIGGPYGRISPSRRWAYFTDEAFYEEGDYIYHAALLFDGTTGKTYAVTPDGIVAIDLAVARRDRRLPEKACYLPAEAPIEWLPHVDVLIVGLCGDGMMVLRPGVSARRLPGDDVVVY
jgi:hypothetical protein